MIGAIITAALALGLSAVSLWVAVLARSEAITCRRELSSHRRAHAEGAEERRATARHRGPEEPLTPPVRMPGPVPPVPDPAPATEALGVQGPPTTEMRAPVALPRPGRIGGKR
jgi:hypothetical protein